MVKAFGDDAIMVAVFDTMAVESRAWPWASDSTKRQHATAYKPSV